MADPVRDNPKEEVEVRPEWLPENFADPEALVKSYQEAQRKISELGEKAKQVDVLEQNLNDLVMQFEQSQQTQPQFDQNTAQERLLEAYESDPIGTIAYLAGQAADARVSEALKSQQAQVGPLAQSQSALVADTAFRALEAQYPNVKDHQEQMLDVLKAQPWLFPEEAKTSHILAQQSLETIYKLVNPSDFVEQQSLNTTDMKRQAQTMTGAGARPPAPDEDKAYWERIKSAGSTGYEAGLRGTQ